MPRNASAQPAIRRAALRPRPGGPPTVTSSPGAASRRTSARAIGPWVGETQAEPTVPTSFSPRSDRVAVRRRLAQPQPAQVAVRLALVVQPGDGLLAHVAALGEAHRALVQARPPRGSWWRPCRARAAAGRTRSAGTRRSPRSAAGRSGLRADHVHAEVGGHVEAELALHERVLLLRQVDARAARARPGRSPRRPCARR